MPNVLQALMSGDTGVDLVEVANSALFDSANSEYLSWTPSGASDTTEWTFSTWINTAGAMGGSGAKTIFSVDGAKPDRITWSGNSGTDKFHMIISGTGTGWLETDAIKRDTGWHHLVCCYHSDDGTAADRQRMWVNGTEITSFANRANVSSGYASGTNSGETHGIGAYIATPNQYFEGYLAETVFIDGASIGGGGLAITDFGEASTDGLYWTPKSDITSLTFGTNGFYHHNENGRAGEDFSVGTGGYSSDLVPDMTAASSPSGTASVDIGSVAGGAVWNPFDKDDGANLVIQYSTGEASLQYDFGSTKTITGYTIQAFTGDLTRSPKDWTLEASNTGSYGGEETVLDTVSGVTGWSASEIKSYTFTNTTAIIVL